MDIESYYEYENLRKQQRAIENKIKYIKNQIGQDAIAELGINNYIANLLAEFKKPINEIIRGTNFDQIERIKDIIEYKLMGRAVTKYSDNVLEVMQSEAKKYQSIPLPSCWGFEDVKMYYKLLNVIGAASGAGKTNTMINLLYDSWQNNRLAVVFSLEMTKGQLWTKLASVHLNKKYGYKIGYDKMQEHIRNGDKDIKEFANEVRDKIIVVDSSRWSASQIISSYNFLIDKLHIDGQKVDQVYVDYLQRIQPEKYNKFNKLDALNETISLLTDKAKKSSSSWVILSQINRQTQKEGYKKRSEIALTSFQGSSNIEQDMALGLYLERRKDDEGEWLPEMQIFVVKNRFGRIMNKKLEFEPRSGSIIRVVK